MKIPCSLLILLSLLLSLPVFAQQEPLLHYRFLLDTVDTKAGQTFSNKLLVENHSLQTVRLYKQMGSNSKAILSLPDSLTIAPKSSRELPLKLLATPTFLRDALNGFQWSYTNRQGLSINHSASFQIRVQEPQRLLVTVSDPVIYLNDPLAPIQFRARYTNAGFSPLILRLSASSSPSLLSFMISPEQVTIAPGAEVDVVYTANSIASNNRPVSDLAVTLEAQDIRSGVILAGGSVQIVSLSSNKRFISINNQGPALNHALELSSLNTKDLSQYRFRANGSWDFSGEPKAEGRKLDYNLNLNQTRASNTGLEAYDTRIRYQTKDLTLTVGNIFSQADYILFGRGASLALNTGGDDKLELIYAQEQYALFTPNPYQPDAANTWAANYHIKRDNRQDQWSGMYKLDPVTGLQTALAVGQSDIKLGEREQLTLIVGASNEMPSGDSLQRQSGIGGGFNYRYGDGRWDLRLNNYLSTGHYAGIRRGVVQLENRSTYHLSSNFYTSLQFSTLYTGPEYFPIETLPFQQGYSRMNTLEWSITGRMTDFLLITLRPYLFLQSAMISNMRTTMQSERLAVDLRLARLNHNFSLSVDWGKLAGQADFNTLIPRESYVLNANYGYRNIGFNAAARIGPYYASDLLQNAGRKEDYYNYSIGPYLNLHFLDKKLNVNLNSQVNYFSTIQGANYVLSAGAQYQASRSWFLAGQLTANRYGAYATGLQTQTSIIKRFNTIAKPTTQLDLTFFEDQNVNGIRETDEPVMEGVVMKLGKMTAQSNRKGEVRLKDVPRNTHRFEVLPQGDRAYQGTSDLVLTKKTSLMIPMVKSGRIIGKLIPEPVKYQNRRLNLEGITVIAQDPQGNTFNTLTDAAGTFVFNLPENTYTISLSLQGLPIAVDQASIPLKLLKDHPTEVIFHIKDKTRKVDVKRF